MDLGFEKRRAWSFLGSVVVERGWSCSDKDGVFLGDSGGFWVGFEEDLVELQEMVNFLLGFCSTVLVKKMDLFVSD